MVSKQRLTTWAVIMVILFVVSVVAFAESTTVSPSSSPAPSPDPTPVTASPVPTATVTSAPSPVPTATVTSAPASTPTTSPSPAPTPVITVTNRDTVLSQAISKTYGKTVTPQDIAVLRINNQLGYGEIGLLYDLANASGKTIADILTLRQTMGWGKIAATLGLKVSDVMKKNAAVMQMAKMDNEEKTLQQIITKEQNENHGKPSGVNASNRSSVQNSNSSHSNSNSNSNSGSSHSQK